MSDKESRNLIDEMYSEDARFKSFKNWPFDPQSKCSAAKMAEAGFFHCPSDKEPDLVQCYVCYKELDGWQAGDEPWEEHYSHSKICVFAQIKKPQKNLTIAEIFKIEAERKFNKIKRLLAQRKQQFNSRCDEIEEFINEIYDSIG